MVKLKKVTLQYVEVEDRIRMSAESDGEEPVVFWLTQRLCGRLVKRLALHLEKSAPQSILLDKGLALTFQQHDAEWRQQPTEPVRIRSISRSVLPERVDLNFPVGGASINFPLYDGESARLEMNMVELRQWMGVVYRQFQAAGWPMDVWPRWFTLADSGRN